MCLTRSVKKIFFSFFPSDFTEEFTQILLLRPRLVINECSSFYASEPFRFDFSRSSRTEELILVTREIDEQRKVENDSSFYSYSFLYFSFPVGINLLAVSSSLHSRRAWNLKAWGQQTMCS